MVISKRIEDLLKRCTPFPWEASWNPSNDTWSIKASPNPGKSKVIAECPKDLSNLDRELMTMAPLLALEVLQLRKKIAELRQ